MSERFPADADLHRPPFPLAWWMPLSVFLGSFVVRLYNIGHVHSPLDDAMINVPGALFYTRWGYLGPDNWWTQPLKHGLMYANILTFGHDMVGWRMRAVVLGSAAIVVAFLIARRVFRTPFPAVATAILLALDPTGLAFALTTNEDVVATLLILLACLFWLGALRGDRDRDWIATGVLFGLAGATRWYAAVPWALAVVLATVFLVRRHGVISRGLSAQRAVGYLGLVPLSVYLLAFGPWFTRGYSIGEWVALQIDSFRVMTSHLSSVYGRLEPLLGAGRWLVTWMGSATMMDHKGSWASFSTMMNDPVLWVLFAPAAAYVLWRGWREHSAGLLIVGGTFVALYAFFATASRPIALYSSIPVIPFGFLTIGYAADRLLKKWAWVFLAFAVAWSVYLYPLTRALPVPLGAYTWLLRRMSVIR